MSRKAEIAKTILAAIGVAGLVVAVAAFPGLPMALSIFMKKKKYNKYQIKRSMDNMKSDGLIGVRNENGKMVLHLTKKGKEKLLMFQLENMRIKSVKKWDGKWRIAAFDIPERFKLARDTFSSKLRSIGFVKFQRSVWVCPYPCEEEIEYLRVVYEIRPFVRLITAEKIEDEINLAKAFNLRV